MLRFAPSPTADMHIGTLQVAIINYLVATQRQENFIVRIEDIDATQNIEGKDTEIIQILEKFALKHDSVSHQSEHLHMHQMLAIRLLEEGKAFVCTCNDKSLKIDIPYCGKCHDVDKSEHAKLKESKTPFAIRIKKPINDIINHDFIQGDIITVPDEVDSFVILDVNGLPTHDFACACDDMLSGVDFIIENQEQISSTAKQMHIKTQLGYETKTTYAHLPMLLDSDAYSVKWMLEEGYIPDAIINYLLFLANTNVPKEIFTLPESIEWFELKNISKSAIKFDLDKLRFINRQHLKRMDDKQLSTLFGFADADIGKLAKLYLEECSTTKELNEKINLIFGDKDFECKWGKEMRTMETLVQDAPMFVTYNTFEAYALKESGLQGKNFFKPLRILLTGEEYGPELSAIYPLIKPYLLEIAS